MRIRGHENKGTPYLIPATPASINCLRSNVAAAVISMVAIESRALPLRNAAKNDDLLYPGYRLLPKAERGMSSLCSRLSGSERYLSDIAGAMGQTATSLREFWPTLVGKVNSMELGSKYWIIMPVRFPGLLDVKAGDTWT